MGHFSETFRLKIEPESCTVQFSVKSTDGRVDMHIIDIRDFNAATQEVSFGWGGCDSIKTKRVGKDVLVSIEESDQKRMIYRFTYQEWRVLCEQFISELRSSGVEVSPYVVKQQIEKLRIPVDDIIIAIQQTVLPHIETRFIELQEQVSQITNNANMIQVTAIHDTSLDNSTPVFIPTDLINSNLEGNASVESDVTSSSSLDDALAALKKLKGERS